MFQGGSIWRPPQMNPYAQGMPEELVEGNNVPEPLEEPPKKGGLTERYLKSNAVALQHVLSFAFTYILICNFVCKKIY